MSLLRTAPLILAVLFFGADLDAAPRTWHDTTGRALKAEFLHADSDKVYLIELTLKCGRDEVLIQSKNTGKGPRLLVLAQSGKSGK